MDLFNLWNWRINNCSLQQQINKAEGDIDSAVHGVVRILGLNRDTQEDRFVYKFDDLISFIHSSPPTKRSLLRVSEKILTHSDSLVLSPFQPNIVSTGVC